MSIHQTKGKGYAMQASVRFKEFLKSDRYLAGTNFPPNLSGCKEEFKEDCDEGSEGREDCCKELERPHQKILKIAEKIVYTARTAEK